MLKILQITTETVITTATIGFIVALGIYLFQKRKNAVPCKWKRVGKVKNVFIYPLKSGRRTELKTALCTEYGLQMPKSGNIYQLRDRNLLIFREDNNEIYWHPKILSIETTAVNENYVILSTLDIPKLKVKIPSSSGKHIVVEVYSYKNEKLRTLDCGDEAAAWLSKYIFEKDVGLRLGFYEDHYRRNITDAYQKYFKFYPQLNTNATGMYSNLTSYMILTQASVNDLKSKLPKLDITVNNFRPNILIDEKNMVPFAEDDWKWLKIGNVILYYVKPCTRCDFTTINPETCIKYENNEPLRTLRKYRLLKDLKKIELDGYRSVMGINMGLHKGGEISVNDIVYVGNA